MYNDNDIKLNAKYIKELASQWGILLNTEQANSTLEDVLNSDIKKEAQDLVDDEILLRIVQNYS